MLLVMKINAFEKSTLRLSAQRQRGFVQNSEEQIPEGVTGLLDFIEQHKTELQRIRVVLMRTSWPSIGCVSR